MPYLAGRFGIIDDMRVIPGAEGRAAAAESFRRLVGIDPVVFGTDYP